MDTKFQTSFIPKKSTTESPGAYNSKSVSVNIFSIIANIVFVVTLLSTGGAYLYRGIIVKQVKEAGVELEAARAAFETDKIKDLVDASNRFNATKKILEKHVVVSELFILLQNTTLKSMRFNNISYNTVNNIISIKMGAEAQSFNAIAQQKDIFSKTDVIKDPNFTDFILTDNGIIKMTFSATVSPSLVSYKKFIESLSLNQ